MIRAALVSAVLLADVIAYAADAPYVPPGCSSIAEFKTAVGDGVTIAKLSPRQFFFLAGVYALNPLTPPGLPPGDGAMLATKEGEDVGKVLWTHEGNVCAPMDVPKALIKLLDDVGDGKIGGGDRDI